jgi:hypothetical protein
MALIMRGIPRSLPKWGAPTRTMSNAKRFIPAILKAYTCIENPRRRAIQLYRVKDWVMPSVVSYVSAGVCSTAMPFRAELEARSHSHSY